MLKEPTVHYLLWVETIVLRGLEHCKHIQINKVFRFLEGIRLHRKSCTIRFFLRKRTSYVRNSHHPMQVPRSNQIRVFLVRSAALLDRWANNMYVANTDLRILSWSLKCTVYKICAWSILWIKLSINMEKFCWSRCNLMP